MHWSNFQVQGFLLLNGNLNAQVMLLLKSIDSNDLTIQMRYNFKLMKKDTVFIRIRSKWFI